MGFWRTGASAADLTGKYGGFIGKIFKGFFVFRKGLFSILLIALIMTQGILGSVKESIQEKKIIVAPLLWEVGGRMVSSDEVIYQHLVSQDPITIPEISGEDTFFIKAKKYPLIAWGYIKFHWVWVSSLITMVMMFVVLYWVFNRFNTSAKWKMVMWTLFFMVLIQFCFSQTFLTAQALKGETTIQGSKELSDMELFFEISKRTYPFKGIGLLAYKLIKLDLTPMYDRFIPEVDTDVVKVVPT